MKTLITLHKKDDAYKFTNQIPSMPEVITVVFVDGSGGYHCLSDGKAVSAAEIANGDSIKLQYLHAAFNNAYRDLGKGEWE